MKYFIDAEFIEGFHKPLFGKKRHFIDLISIGIVAEDGRTYYAVSSEFNQKDADEWVKDNVIYQIEVDFFTKMSPEEKNRSYAGKGNKAFRYLQEKFGKPNAQIASEIEEFVNHPKGDCEHEFYGYYCDYDWVLLCSLFGRMIDLPRRFPMYCRDVKQIIDEKALSIKQTWVHPPAFEDKLNLIKKDPMYPREADSHNALSDAKWIFELYKFLLTK